MIGMQRQEVEYKGEQELKIVMRENNETLNEVMVIGYGSTTRKDMTVLSPHSIPKSLNRRQHLILPK